ncbi:MAG: NEW3 domain-containing protein [Gemmatimonas sp.]
MRRTVVAFLLSMILAIGAASAADTPAPKGLWLVTDYPAVTVRAGETASIRMKLQNSGLAPERAALTVQGLPAGWKAQLIGGGQPVEAAMPFTNDMVSLELRLDIPREQTSGTYNLTVQARGANASATLPLQVTLGQELPAKLTLKPKLPSLKGTVKASFDYEFTVKNDSGKAVLVNLSAQTPPNFQRSFTENYGSQEINSIPLDAGQSKDLKLKVQLPPDAGAGNYDLLLTASAEGATAEVPLQLQATGQSKLRLTGKDERLSAKADAGQASQVTLVVVNDGTAPAENVSLSASPPTDWKVDFDTKTIPEIGPSQRQEVTATITPAAKAIAGDYMTTFRANATGDSTSADFRVAVTTSTLWGAFGIAIIAIALLILVGAVARFGRR